jgi:uncharacterized protein (TIGR01370 family)
MTLSDTTRRVLARTKDTGGRPARRTFLQALAEIIAAGVLCAPRPLVARALPPSSLKWVAFYGQTVDEALLASYDVVVLDPMFMGSVAAAGQRGARVCGYISLGEINASDPFYKRVDNAALLEENLSWPGTRRIDVRHHSWAELMIEEVIPSIVDKGFAGLMLDTLDTPPYLEVVDPEGRHGMRQAAVDLVCEIRRYYPNLFIIMNRGYALLPSVIHCIDAVIAESLLTSPDPKRSGAFKWNEPALVDLQLSLLAPTKQRSTSLPILSLDYWDPLDTDTIEKIYSRQRQLGHHPYVAVPTLDQIFIEN